MKPVETQKPRGTPLSTVFYGELTFITCSFLLSSCALLTPHIAVLLWMPALITLSLTLVSLASLITLNKGVALRSKQHLLFYVVVTFILVIVRILCSCLLLLGLFTAHAKPGITFSLSFVSLVHAVFGLLAATRTAVYRNVLDRRVCSKDFRTNKVEEMTIANLATTRLTGSQATLVTNLDECELVNFN